MDERCADESTMAASRTHSRFLTKRSIERGGVAAQMYVNDSCMYGRA
jgi:hypothetical protein